MTGDDVSTIEPLFDKINLWKVLRTEIYEPLNYYNLIFIDDLGWHCHCKCDGFVLERSQDWRGKVQTTLWVEGSSIWNTKHQKIFGNSSTYNGLNNKMVKETIELKTLIMLIKCSNKLMSTNFGKFFWIWNINIIFELELRSYYFNKNVFKL